MFKGTLVCSTIFFSFKKSESTQQAKRFRQVILFLFRIVSRENSDLKRFSKNLDLAKRTRYTPCVFCSLHRNLNNVKMIIGSLKSSISLYRYFVSSSNVFLL